MVNPMSYMLRDRPDGQVEIVLTHTTLVGIFPEREVGQKICAWLQEDLIEWPEDAADDVPADPSSTAEEEANAEAAAAVDARFRDLVEAARPVDPPPPRTVRNLPAVVQELPTPARVLTPRGDLLTVEQKDAAFARIIRGERISTVALDFNVSTSQMVGLWSQHKRRMQAHIAEGGKVPCALCNIPFMPSLTHPDTCARCSHE